MARKSTSQQKPKYQYVEETAYEIREPEFGTFPVRKTANAWWDDKTKVEKLIQGKKIFERDESACYFAGITKRQLDYFLQVHPHFCELFELLPMDGRNRARMTIYNSLDRVEVAQWYAEHRMADEFSKRSQLTGAEGKDLFPDRLSDDQVLEMAEIVRRTVEERKRLEATQKT